MKKILLIRFSSFGDVVQAMNASRAIKLKYPEAEIIWLSKKMFSNFLEAESSIDHVISLEDFDGSLWKLKTFIIEQKFDLIYDAHRNLRTLIIRFLLLLFGFSGDWIFRPKSRWKRFLLFKFRINFFEDPFFSKLSYLAPIKLSHDRRLLRELSEGRFNISYESIVKSKFPFVGGRYVVLAPSAAWEMKRWPTDKWSEVIKKISEDNLVILVGGPNDLFIEDLYTSDNQNVLNLAGRTDFYETFYLVEHSSYVLSADTGVIHIADLIHKRGGLLLGPTAFGRTHSYNITIFEEDMPCRPCTKDGRGGCSRETYQECMVNISVDRVLRDMGDAISSHCLQ